MAVSGTFTDHRGWTDLSSDGSKFLPPNIVITAEDLALHGEAGSASHLYNTMLPRIVEYHDAANDERYTLEMYFYIHPVGSSDLNLSLAKNRLILGNGDGLTIATTDSDAIAGACLSNYYTNTAEFTNTSVSFAFTTLTAGDGIWVVRRGRFPMEYNGTVAANKGVKSGAGGELVIITALHTSTYDDAEVEENFYGPVTEVVGISRASATAGSVFDTELHLPKRYKRFA